MAKIRVAQIKDLSLENGVITIGPGKSITPLTTVSPLTEAGTNKFVSGFEVTGNTIKPLFTEISFAGYATETFVSNAINTALADYSTTTEMNSAISSAISTALADYSTTEQMNSAISTALAGYYTKDEIDNTLGNYVLKTDIATEISASPVDTKVASEKAVKSYVDSKIQAADAMRYKGTVAAESDLPTNAVNGDTYKAFTGFTLENGTKLEAGDMLIYNGTSWDVVQGNIDLASLTGATSDATNREYAVKQNAAGNLVVTVDPLNITEDEHYTPTPGATLTTTNTIDLLTGGELTIVTDEVDAKGHVIGKDTTTVTVDATALTERLEAIDEAIAEASASASLVMKREVLTVAAGKTPRTDLSELPVGDVAITQNGLDLGIGEYTVSGVSVNFNLDVEAVTDDVFVAYYMYNTEGANVPS